MVSMPDAETDKEMHAPSPARAQVHAPAPGMYHHIRRAWKDPDGTPMWGSIRERRVRWRREPTIVRVDRPTRLDRARELGYKAKQGVVVARVRVRRGGQRRRAIRGGRRPKRKGVARLTLGISIQRIAENRAARKFPNMEVLNSYWVGEDGRYRWYEVILVDRSHPAVRADRELGWICDPANSDRANRGLTSAGKKGRGLRRKGVGAENLRPSRRATVKKRIDRGRRTQRSLFRP